MRRNYFSRMMAMTLSGILAFSNVDLTVFASGNIERTVKTITGFEELDDSIIHQTINAGDSEDDIFFPESLSVTVTYQEEKETRKKIEKEDEQEENTETADEASTAESVEDTEEPSEDISPEEADDGQDTEKSQDESSSGSDGETQPDTDAEQEETDGSEEYDENVEDLEHSEEGTEASEENESSSDDGETGEEAGDVEESEDGSLLGMIFPVIKAYAASGIEDLDVKDSSDDEQSTESEDDEEISEEDQYEIVKEIVDVTENITLSDISWELDVDESSFDEFTSEEPGARFVYVPVFSDEYTAQADIPTITVTVVEKEIVYEYMVLEDGGVRVEGNLPAGTRLNVSSIDLSEAEGMLDDPDRKVLYAVDVTLTLDGEVIEPDDSVRVTISSPVDESILGDDQFELVHIREDESQEIVDSQVNDQGEVEFEIDGFTPILFTTSSNAGYDVEFAEGKSFTQSVKVNFTDASMIKPMESYVVLRLMGNIGRQTVKISDSEVVSAPFLIAERNVVINATIDDGEGNTKASEVWSFNNIPVYVLEGTGAVGNLHTYEIPENFYGIEIQPAEGYSVSTGAIDSGTYYNLSPVKDINDAVWSTSQILIENNMLEVVNPSFIVDWQDNRNYADNRPFTTGTSIEGQEENIKNAISLFYKDDEGYHEISVKPTVVGGPFSWRISYKNLPMYQEGETLSQYYISISDEFYNGKKAFYSASGLNADGYLPITADEENVSKLTMSYTEGVTGTVYWRIGNENISVIPDLPQEGLFSDDNNTMLLYKKVGDGTPVLVNDPYSVIWTESSDKKTWSYNITGLPLYMPNGDGILYYTKIQGTSDSTYKYTYDNGEDSTETDKCLPGQKIYATLIGNGTFSFTKKWYDDNDDDSKARRALAIDKGITFYLWRYPVNGSLADGAPVTNNAKQFSFALKNEHAQQDDFTISLQDFATEAGVPGFEFPKFDEKGYAYIYYATEVSKSELFETKYWNQESEFSGESNEKCVLDHGTVCNVRSARIAPGVTKYWSVSAVPDYVSSTCTFVLQRKVRGEWENVNGATVSLTGFSSSKKRVSGAFGSQDLYDPLGKRYEYRVIESAVESGSGIEAVFDDAGWTSDDSDTYSAGYTLNDYTYKAVSTYNSTVENGVETAEALITNKLSGTKKLHVIKTWAGSAWGIGTENDKTGDITIEVKRAVDGQTPVLYATMVLEKPEAGEESGIVTFRRYEPQELTENYLFDVSNSGTSWRWATRDIIVPAYTDDGAQYVYSIDERSIATTDPELVYADEYDRTITGKKIDLYVTNRIGSTTNETKIVVDKVWKDDSDSSQRSKVKIQFGTYDSEHNFTPVEPYELILSDEKDYSNYIWVDGSKFKADPSETSAQAIHDHLAIKASLYNSNTGEYDRDMVSCTYGGTSGCVTGGFIPAIVDDNNSFYRPGYKVSVERNTTGTYFKLTNTRAASRAFAFEKKWEDSANILGLRGDFLRVALFREVNDAQQEVAFIDIPTYTDDAKTELTSGNDLKVRFTNNDQYYPAYDENGNNYIYSMKEYICTGVPQGQETLCPGGVEPSDGVTDKKEISITATKETTTTGYVVERENGGITYDEIDGQYDLGQRGVGSILMTESYTYTNKAAGERSEVPFYIVWHDKAKSNERADIYFTLYYKCGEDGELIPYTGAYTERWEDVEAGNKFVQKAIFSGLPSADENGNVYTYYVTETFNNSTTDYITEHYVSKLRNSDDTDYNLDAVVKEEIETTQGTDHQLLVADGIKNENNSVQVGNRFFTKEGSFTLASISDNVKIEGRKLWLGIPDGIEVGKLPGAQIYLFRSSEYDKSNEVPDTEDEYLTKSVNYNNAGAAAESKSPQELNSTKSMYVFGTYDSSGNVASYAQFPKYDEMGYQYTYSVREIIYNKFHNELPAEVMIPIYSNNTTDLSNQYKLSAETNKRDFVVHKQWSIGKRYYDSDLTNKDARATFRLYRLELESDGHGYDVDGYARSDDDPEDKGSSLAASASFGGLDNPYLELVDEEIITSSDSVINWDNEPIFAPSGKLYAYYAVELTDDMPGYKAALNGFEPTSKLAEGSGATPNNKAISGDGYIGVTFANTGVNLSQSHDANEKTEYFRNTYTTDEFNSITFTKKWVAKNYDETTIQEMIPGLNDNPSALRFSLYAIANTQSGKGNQVRIDIPATDYTVSAVAANTDGSEWHYTLKMTGDKKLPKYSANGNLYTYYVKEELNSDFVTSNYSKATELTYAKADNAVVVDENETRLDMTRQLQNNLKGKFTVQKIWDDFSNDYGMREGSISFNVFYTVGNSGNWTKYNSTPYVLSASNSWKMTISGLPVTSREGLSYQYRVWEKEIRAENSTLTLDDPDLAADYAQTQRWIKNGTTTDDGEYYFEKVQAGNYQVYNPSDMTSIAASPTKKLINQLDTVNAVVSLEVTKNWSDMNDLYGIRPSSVSVTLQSSKDNGANWTNVTTRQITSDDADPFNANTWKKKFTNLPKYCGTEGNTYKYRAIETKVGTTDVTPDELDGLNGTGGSYKVKNVPGSYTDLESNITKYTTVVTNTLNSMDTSINVKKRWNSNSAQGEVKVALYSTNFNGGSGSGAPAKLSFAGSEKTLNAENSWMDSYKKLPKFNKDGKPIVYYVKEETTGNFKTQYMGGTEDSPTEAADDNLRSTTGDATSDYYVIVINTPLTSVEGSKIWHDDNNKYHLRPDSLSLTLQRRTVNPLGSWEPVTYADAQKTGATGITKGADNLAKVSVSATGNWKATALKLPLYALSDGTAPVKYQYRLAELDLPNAYTTDESSYSYGGDDIKQTSSVTNTLITRGVITVNKVWNTSDAGDKEEVEVKLFSENLVSGADSNDLTEVATATISGNSWKHEFSGLPAVNKNGTEIVYYVAETAAANTDTAYYVQDGAGGFTKVSKDAAKTNTTGAFDFKVVNTPLTSITGSKNWVDDNNGFGLRVSQISLTLQRRTGNGEWEDVSADELHKTNAAADPTVTVTSATAWKATIDKLPSYVLSDGATPVKYQYRLAETTMPNGYTRNVDKEISELTDEDGYEYGTDTNVQTSKVSNYLILRKHDITVKKVWNTGDTEQMQEVTVKLLSRNFENGTDSGSGNLTIVKNGAVDYVRTLNGTTGWETVFSALPLKNQDGEDIVYYISETTGNGFSTKYYVYDGSTFNEVEQQQVRTNGDVALLTRIVNTPFTTATVEKRWSDQNNKFLTRPESVYVKLQRKTTDETVWTDAAPSTVIELNAANDWKATVSDLELYKGYDGATPVRYEYRFIETDASGSPFVPLGYSLVSGMSDYVSSCDGTEPGYANSYADSAYKTIITNTLITKTVTAVKKWDDDSDTHRIRPSEISLTVEGSYVLGSGGRITNADPAITPQKSSDGNIWTYEFEGLPKYEYGVGASAANPAELAYNVTEDVTTPGAGGFVLENYYVTTYEVTGDTTTITNTAMENDGILIIEKAIKKRTTEENVTTYGFPFSVTLSRPDGSTIPFSGDYYLYDADPRLSDDELREDSAKRDDEAHLERIKQTSSDGIIRISAGTIAVLTGINSMYRYTVSENPYHAFYEVLSITGCADTEIVDDASGGKNGIARGQILKNTDPGVSRVKYTNQILNYLGSAFLKIENITVVTTDDQGEALTGGEVKVFRSRVIVNDRDDLNKGDYGYKNDETPYIEHAVSVEFHADSQHGYTYADDIVIQWWGDGDDTTSAAAPNSVVVSGYVYTDSDGQQHVYTGKLIKNDDGTIELVSGSEKFKEVWGPLLENSPFKNLTVLENSVVITLASDIIEMPPKTLVQVKFVPPAEPEPEPTPEPAPAPTPTPAPVPAPEPAPTPDKSDSSGKGSDSKHKGDHENSSNNDSSESTASVAVVVATAAEDDKNQLQDALSEDADRTRNGEVNGIRTGDNTPLTAIFMLFIAFALGFAAAVGKYLKARPKKK